MMIYYGRKQRIVVDFFWCHEHQHAVSMHRLLATATNIAGLGCTVIQGLSVFDKLDKAWSEPISEVISIVRLIGFGMNVASGACYISHGAVPGIIVVTCLALKARYLWHSKGYGSGI